MTDETTAPSGGDAIALPSDAPESFGSIREAADYLSGLSEKKPPVESADPATAESELSGEDNAAPAEKLANGEDEEADPADEPLIELPKSWAKERAELWTRLDPEAKQFLLEQDRTNSAEVRRAQNEAAEKTKAVETKVKEAEQAKQHYEVQAQAAMQVLLDRNNDKFGMIKSQADLNYLSSEASRLAGIGEIAQSQQILAFLGEWETNQKAMAVQKMELTKIEGDKAQKQQNEARERKTREHALLIEKAPEYADAKKLKAAQDAAVELFREKGCTDEWFQQNGDNPILDDHHLQLIISDAMKYREVMKAKVVAVPKDVPQVQRPGISRPPGAQTSEREQALTRKPSLDLKEATELYELQHRRRA